MEPLQLSCRMLCNGLSATWDGQRRREMPMFCVLPRLPNAAMGVTNICRDNTDKLGSLLHFHAIKNNNNKEPFHCI